MNGPRTRTLRRALEILGTRESLAAALSIAPAELERYLAQGDAALPQDVFLKALDIVAHAPRGER